MKKANARVTAGFVLVLVSLAMSSWIPARSIKARSHVAGSQSLPHSQQDKKPLDVEPTAVDVIDQTSGSEKAGDRAKREAKSRRYDKKDKWAKRLTDLPSGGGVVRGNEAPPFLAIPVAQSDAVVICTVTKVQPYLTQNETGMYTEFTVQVEEILKNDVVNAISIGSTVVVDREAGAMRLSDGRVIRYESAGVGKLPRGGRRYVLFLRRINNGEDLSILTGYELRTGRVFPLDGETSVFSPQTGQITRKAPFEGADEGSFLNLVRTAVLNPDLVLTPQRGIDQ